MFIFLVLMSNLSQSRDLLIKRPQTEREGQSLGGKTRATRLQAKRKDVNDKIHS